MSFIDNNLQNIQDKLSNLNEEIASEDLYFKKIIGIYGTEGGVGASSLLNEIALYFANKGKKILIIDSNLLYPYQSLLYTDDTNKIESFVDILKDIQKFSNCLFKSKYSTNIDYCYQRPLSPLEYIEIVEKYSYYTYLKKLFIEIKKFYDIIFIDLNMNDINNFITVNYIKHCELFIEVRELTLKSELNIEHIKDNILMFNSFINFNFVIYNKVIYNTRKLFVKDGVSNNNNYLEHYKEICQKLEQTLTK